MVNLFRHYVPLVTLVQLGFEAGLFFLAVLVGAVLQAYAFGGRVSSTLLPAFFFAVLMVSVIGAFGLYRRDQAMGFPRYVLRFVIAVSIGLLLAAFLTPLWANGSGHREALEFAVPVAIAGVLAVRMAFAKRPGAALFTHRILVLGTGADALAVERTLATPPVSGVAVVAFFPVGSGEHAAVPRHRILPSDQSLEGIVATYGIREVIVAVREQRGGVLPLQELLSCRLRGVRVTDLFSFYERARGELPVDSLKASSLIYGDGFRQDWLRCHVKRMFDVIAAMGLLVIMAPVMLAIAIAIVLESGGPVIFRQQRVGMAGRTFTLFKFRSMRHDAEPDGQARWAQASDPRVTRLGRLMRRMRIDELPQLWNVLRGEMSFVGPRPERPCFVAELSKTIPFYPARHTVKPGITGWAQVRFTYGASVEDATRKLQFDLYYVKNHSLFLDLLILLETVRVVLYGEGAR